MYESLLEPAIKVTPPGKKFMWGKKKEGKSLCRFYSRKRQRKFGVAGVYRERDRKNEKRFHERALYDFSSTSQYYAIRDL